VEPAEEHIVRVDGRVVDVEVTASPFEDLGTRAIHVVLSDITERKRAEAAVRQLSEELEQRVVARTAELDAANKELESFSYSVSHDLRAPLRAISGFASILARRYRDDLDEKGRHYVDTIVSSSDHMGVLIEELLDYSRIGRRTVRAEPVPLGPLMVGLRVTFGDRIAASGAEFDVVEPLATPVGDRTLIERILANLVDNALTYRRPDVAPHVTLSATRHRRTLTLAVADNGIPPEYRERIFEVFARLHTDEEYPGTGIGLSIVRKAARLMGSNVIVESTEGAGSTFSLDLPAAQKRSTPS
jgi:signal transduction histidine kinase